MGEQIQEMMLAQFRGFNFQIPLTGRVIGLIIGVIVVVIGALLYAVFRNRSPS
jgi:hypothetical protein